MKSKLIVIAACAALLAVGIGAAALDGGREEYARYHQHREAQQLSDLSAEDQAAASSTSIDPATFASHLPVVSIDTRGQAVPGERVHAESESAADEDDGDPYDATYTLAADGRETVATDFALYDHDGANRLTDEPALATQAEVRYRGHSSREFDKKSYAVTFTEADRITNRNLDVLGMGADEDWVLNGPFLDKTLLRNYLSMNVAGQFMANVPEVRLCELFVNGVYQGVYVLMETVKVTDERVRLTATDDNSSATSYMVRRDWRVSEPGTNVFEDLLYAMLDARETQMEIRYPAEDEITADQRAWIVSDINRIEKSLYSYDYDTPTYGYWTTLDVDSFVDYAVFNEFTLNSDAGYYSTYLYKDVRGKLAIGPLWDFNNAYNNAFEDDLMDAGFTMVEKPYYFMLFKDERFVERVIDRYRELRETYLADDALVSYIDEAVAYLGPAVERNYAVWGYSFDPAQLDADLKLTPDERNPLSFEEAVADLKDFILARGGYMDAYIDNLKQYAHESAVKQYNH